MEFIDFETDSDGAEWSESAGAGWSEEKASDKDS
jgi:hypothetical protein